MAFTEAKQKAAEKACAQLRIIAPDLKSIQDDTTSSAADIATNTADIATNTADIATNTADIATNTADIATNTAAIAAVPTGDSITVTDLTSSDQDNTYTTAQLLGRLIRRDGMSTTRTDTLPSAADLVAAMTNPSVGSAVIFSVQNESTGNELVITSGTGGTDVATATQRRLGTSDYALFAVVLTNVTPSSEAYSLYMWMK